MKVTEWVRSQFSNPVVFINTITTGTDDDAELIGVCTVGESGAPVVSLRSDITEQELLPAQQFHKITIDLVRNSGEAPDSLQGRIGEMLNGSPVVVYNAPFQRKFLRQFLGYEPSVIDITVLARFVYSHFPTPVSYSLADGMRYMANLSGGTSFGKALALYGVTEDSSCGFPCESRALALRSLWEALDRA